jgi:hypothetical protein
VLVIIWCIILFGLGLAAFFDGVFSYGEVFRQFNSVLFMLVSLGLMVRAITMARRGDREAQEARLRELEMALHEARFIQLHSGEKMARRG